MIFTILKESVLQVRNVLVDSSWFKQEKEIIDRLLGSLQNYLENWKTSLRKWTGTKNHDENH